MMITKVKARQILDSRGYPTVEAEVHTESCFGRAAVPAGASKGEKEAHELRDGEDEYEKNERRKEHRKKEVKNAVRNVNEIIFDVIKNRDVENQREVDDAMIELDGTENKSNLGANAILAVSLAVARCAAKSLNKPLYSHLSKIFCLDRGTALPAPMFNIINGGAHAPNKLDFQEFMIVPEGASDFEEALRMGSETYHELEKILGGKQPLGDEGGFSPQMNNVFESLDAILKAVENLEYEKEVKLALDCAPSYFYKPREGRYLLEGRPLTPDELIDFYKDLVEMYPIISIEDPLVEKDIKNLKEKDIREFQKITRELGEKIRLVGDDLFVTDPERLKKGIELKIYNTLLLKVNQIGTLSEAVDAASIAFKNQYQVIVSHRSGETEDTFISHLAVALNCGWIKAGAPARGERTAKYNELLRIEEILEEKARHRTKS